MCGRGLQLQRNGAMMDSVPPRTRNANGFFVAVSAYPADRQSPVFECQRRKLLATFLAELLEDRALLLLTKGAQ